MTCDQDVSIRFSESNVLLGKVVVLLSVTLIMISLERLTLSSVIISVVSSKFLGLGVSVDARP